MTIPNGVNRSPGVNTVNKELNHKTEEKAQKTTSVDGQEKPSDTVDSQSFPRTRNISFKLNEESNTMYVEITNEKNEVIRTIPADEDDPTFRALKNQAFPGMILNNKG